MSPLRPRRLAPLAALAAALVAAPHAGASQLIDRNATRVSLRVDAAGEALVTYVSGGTLEHVLAWGAVNALPPTKGGRQVAFRLDYSGGYAKYHRDYWKAFPGGCGSYDGPPLAWVVAACKAPDGSYWALQSWQRDLPDLGLAPTPSQAAWELRLSHWTGQLPVLEVQTDWSYHRYDQLFGRYLYDGTGVYGFRATADGSPLDSFGRNVYLDTYDSAYGTGWKRENSFLTHTGTGAFCYGVYPHQNGGTRPAGAGTRYRATAEGPGVTPDVMWEGPAPGPYDAAADASANAAIRALHDPRCRAN